MGIIMKPGSLEAWLLEPFDKFARTGVISIDLVFRCVCWIRSIAALQGDRGLARTMSLPIKHMWDLSVRLAASIEINSGLDISPGRKESLHALVDAWSCFSPYMRVNPLLTGCIQFDRQTSYLTIANDSLVVSLFRPFCHVYSALRDRRLLDAIPFIEDAIQVYEASVFTPSRAAATRGSYARSYLASHNLIETTALNRRVNSRPGRPTSVIGKGRFRYISNVMRLLHNDEYSVVQDARSTSWTALLAAVSSVCKDELFGSRVLSRDALTLGDDLVDVFDSLCDVLGRHRARLESTAPIDREWCAKRVCTIYDHYHKSVSTVLSSGILSTGGMVKNELQDAGRVAVLLDAFRQHPRPPDPEPGEYSDVSSVLYALITPSDHESFMHFFIYMETVAVESWYSGLRQLWRTIVGLMEGCLLSMQARHDAFRGLVEQYTYAHRGGVGRGAVSAPTTAISRELEWYTSDHGITDSQDLLRLDRLYGCPHYMRVKVPSGSKNPAFAECRSIINEKCSRVVYVDTYIVAGAETKEQLRAIETVVLAAAKQTGLKLQYDEAEDLNLRLVEIKGFEFSATGIVRKAS